jgi:hypothetical protein
MICYRVGFGIRTKHFGQFTIGMARAQHLFGFMRAFARDAAAEQVPHFAKFPIWISLIPAFWSKALAMRQFNLSRVNPPIVEGRVPARLLPDTR